MARATRCTAWTKRRAATTPSSSGRTRSELRLKRSAKQKRPRARSLATFGGAIDRTFRGLAGALFLAPQGRSLLRSAIGSSSRQTPRICRKAAPRSADYPGGRGVRHRRARDDRNVAADAGTRIASARRRLAHARCRHRLRHSRAGRPMLRRARGDRDRQRPAGDLRREAECAGERHPRREFIVGDVNAGRSRQVRRHRRESVLRAAGVAVAEMAQQLRRRTADPLRRDAQAGARTRATRLSANRFAALEVRRRGKWIALARRATPKSAVDAHSPAVRTFPHP